MPAPDAATIRALVEHVEKAKGSDRDLNVALAVELTGWCRHEHKTWSGCQGDTGFTCDACGADSWGNKSRAGQHLYDECPAYTASIDAAVALVERALPSHSAGFQPMTGGAFRGHIIRLSDTSAHLVRDAVGPSAPLAILLALLNALLSQAEAASHEQ